MQIKKRLRINAIVTVITAAAIFILLFLALYRVNRAVEAAKIGDNIIASGFERVALRNDYIRTNSERAKIQWRAKHEQAGKLLKTAAERFRNAENKNDIDEMFKSNESIGNIFAAIVANREKADLSPDPAGLSQEVENRLISQLNMRVYEAILHGRSFQEWSTRTLFSALKFAGGGIISILAIVVAAALSSSWIINRAISDRVRRLGEGAALIGGGNLAHRIYIDGDDEFTEISGAFNAMSAKLCDSYHDLEMEITERKHAEERLWAQARTLKALNNGNHALMHATDELSLLQAVCRIVVEDCGHAMAWIGFAEDDEAKSVRPMAYAGFEQGYLETLNVTWADTGRGQSVFRPRSIVL